MKARQPVHAFRHDGLYISYIDCHKGRGVFCAADVTKDTLLEIAPVLLMSGDDREKILKTSLKNYTFSLPTMPKNVARGSHIPVDTSLSGLAMGITSFCNHAARPNARYETVEDGISAYLYLYADTDIPAGTEICISYGKMWFALRNLSGAATN